MDQQHSLYKIIMDVEIEYRFLNKTFKLSSVVLHAFAVCAVGMIAAAVIQVL